MIDACAARLCSSTPVPVDCARRSMEFAIGANVVVMARRKADDNDGLFRPRHPVAQPLADRMRPRTLDEIVGQEHLLGPGKLLSQMVAAGTLHSMILWGPPGTGKTTIALLLAQQSGAR